MNRMATISPEIIFSRHSHRPRGDQTVHPEDVPGRNKERYKQSSPADYLLLKDFYYRLPTITLTGDITVYLGDHTFKIMHLPGHTLINWRFMYLRKR